MGEIVNKRTKKVFELCMLSTFLMAANSAHGELLKGDFLMPGDGALITDTETGLEWLTPYHTRNTSYDEIMAGEEELVTTHDFRYATAEMVRTMIDTNFDYPHWLQPQSDDYGDAATYPAAESFFELFGINAEFNCVGLPAGLSGPCPRTQGLVADINPESPELSRHYNIGMLTLNGINGYAFQGAGWLPTAKTQQLGHWLVRGEVITNHAPMLSAINLETQLLSVNEPVNASAVFTDEDEDDTHELTIDWGDGSIETFSNVASPTANSHGYTQAGVYTITMTITDEDGESDSADYQYLVAYDASAGFVTGGGNIDSPIGAFAVDEYITGKASFGFNAKYKKGESIPRGNVQFTIKEGDLNFHSSHFDWLVVTDVEAKIHGQGSVNQEGDYGFLLSVVDNDLAGDGAQDKLRIKIWDKNNGDIVVYDNQMGGSDDDLTIEDISKGNIIIHSK